MGSVLRDPLSPADPRGPPLQASKARQAIISKAKPGSPCGSEESERLAPLLPALLPRVAPTCRLQTQDGKTGGTGPWRSTKPHSIPPSSLSQTPACQSCNLTTPGKSYVLSPDSHQPHSSLSPPLQGANNPRSSHCPERGRDSQKAQASPSARTSQSSQEGPGALWGARHGSRRAQLPLPRV